MISSADILSRCSLVRSAWAGRLPRLASTTPTAVATPAALQKSRRSNRSLPLFNRGCCIVALLRFALGLYLDDGLSGNKLFQTGVAQACERLFGPLRVNPCPSSNRGYKNVKRHDPSNRRCMVTQIARATVRQRIAILRKTVRTVTWKKLRDSGEPLAGAIGPPEIGTPIR